MVIMREMLPGDWQDVKRIYEEGIQTGHATFEQSAPGWEEWNNSHLQHSRLVAIYDNSVAGWAAVSPVSGRCVYGGVAEVSVYVSMEHRGQNIGKKLLGALIEETERNGLWTLQAGIFPENRASIMIHEKNGFRTVGYRERIGKMNGKWRDTILLERRSARIGT